MSANRKLLIVFHSQSGRTERLALACFQSVREFAEVEVRLRRAIDAATADLLWADGLMILTPENLGTAAGGIKDFLDRVYYPAERAGCVALPYALVVAAGNSGTGCGLQLERILKGMQTKKIQETLYVYGVPQVRDLERCREMALGFAAGLQIGIF